MKTDGRFAYSKYRTRPAAAIGAKSKIARMERVRRSKANFEEGIARTKTGKGVPKGKLGTFLFGLVRPEDRGDDLVFEVRDEIRKPPKK